MTRHELGKITTYRDLTTQQWTATAKCACGASIGTSRSYDLQSAAKGEIQSKYDAHASRP